MDKKFNFLKQITLPKVIKNALNFYGIKEVVGNESNPIIVQWAEDLGLKDYTTDSIPWCGLAVAKVVSLSGFEVVKNPLWARNWAKFGTIEETAMLGDVLVFSRKGGGGHVGFYIGESEKTYFVIGGNQSDTFNIAEISKKRCISINRCKWKIKQPESVKRYVLNSSGFLSVNEQ